MATYATREEAVAAGCDPKRVIEVSTVDDRGLTVEFFEMSAELSDRLVAARAEWKRLEEAGTPYWCVHEDRSVTHPQAYWKDDTPDAPIHRKHGVMCRDCGGYIQEG